MQRQLKWLAVFYLCFAGSAEAQISTQSAASMLIFPRISTADDSDTLIEVGNASSNLRNADCYYVANGSAAGVTARFQISVIGQQPTHWSARRGRAVDPTDPTCRTSPECDGAGLDVGTIPALGENFAGFLVCVEVDVSGFPVAGNALTGQATVIDGSGRISKYNAVGVRGFDTNNEDNTLCVGGDPSAICPSGAEYAACPTAWFLETPGEGVTDLVAGADWVQHTTISIVPCGYNLVANQFPTLQVEFAVENEFQQTFSASATVQGGGDVALADLGDAFHAPLGSIGILNITVRPTVDSPSFILVARTLVEQSGGASVPVAYNAQTDTGEANGVVVLQLPVSQGQP